MSAEQSIPSQGGANPPLASLLHADRVRSHANVASRKRVLQEIARLLCDDNLAEDVLFDGLMERERLGSTGLGEGVAIPHCRLPVERMRVALVSLEAPIDYEAVDARPVDLLFVLVVPVDEPRAHLDALAALSEVFANSANCRELRACTDDTALCETMQTLLTQSAASAAT